MFGICIKVMDKHVGFVCIGNVFRRWPGVTCHFKTLREKEWWRGGDELRRSTMLEV